MVIDHLHERDRFFDRHIQGASMAHPAVKLISNSEPGKWTPSLFLWGNPNSPWRNAPSR
jgi:hypothetical protein